MIRIWDNGNRKMYDWDEIKGETLESIHENTELDVIQWTGIRDKNKKKIYEGDIVYIKDYNHIGKVFLNHYHGWVISGICMSVKLFDRTLDVEVIGDSYRGMKMPNNMAKVAGDAMRRVISKMQEVIE